MFICNDRKGIEDDIGDVSEGTRCGEKRPSTVCIAC